MHVYNTTMHVGGLSNNFISAQVVFVYRLNIIKHGKYTVLSANVVLINSWSSYSDKYMQ